MKTLNRLSIFAACMLLGMPLAGQAAENPRFEVQGTETVAGTPLPDAELIFGLTTTNRIISFAPGAPNVLLSNVQILGLGIGENVVGIDFRPATEELYGVTDGSRVLRIDVGTGATTQIGPGFLPVVLGTSFGMDFNPTVDRIRLVSDLDQNLRLHPDTGLVAAMDLPLNYAAGDPNFGVSPNISGVAYANNFPGSTSTTLYGIDFNTDSLVIQNPPNDGTLTTLGPLLGIETSDLVGFDIQSRSGTAFASLTAPFSLLASAFGGGGDELSQVAFANGSAVVTPQAAAGLDKVAKALLDRPMLKMTVVGTASLEAERAAFKRRRLQELLQAEQRRAGVSAGALAPPATATSAPPLQADPAAEGEWLRQVYLRSEITKPRDLDGKAKVLPPEEMEALLLANIPVDDEAMRALALQRGVAVKDYLIGLKLPAERLFLGAAKAVVPDAKWSPHAELKLGTN